MTITFVLLIGFLCGTLSAIFLLPGLVAHLLKTMLARANQSMAYHNMTGRQVQSLINEALPFLGRFLSPRGAATIADSLRTNNQHQVKSIIVDQSVETLASDSQIQTKFALTAPEIIGLMTCVDLSTHVLVTDGPANYYPSMPPVGSIHLPAEHQTMRGALVHWPTGYPTRWPQHAQLIDHITSGGEAHIVVRDEAWGRLVLSYLLSQDVALDDVKLIIAPTDDLWVRDSGPTLVNTDRGKVAIANVYTPNGLGYHRRDTEAAIVVAQAWGLETHRLPLIVEGGNLVPDGNGTLFMCDSVFAHNPDVDREQLKQIMLLWFGITQLVILPTLPGDITGHADIIIKVAEPGALLLTQAPKGHVWHDALEEAVSCITETLTCDGRAWQILRMPIPHANKEWTYVNALTVNNVLIAPSYDDEADEIALQIFNKASPTRRVCWVDYRAFMVGAVHCQTKEIPQ
jgi:agmatine deiminase